MRTFEPGAPDRSSMSAADLIGAALVEPCRPWSRHLLGGPEWAALLGGLADDQTLTLRGMWADTTAVHSLFRQQSGMPLLLSVATDGGAYAALSPARPMAALFERMIRDLWGHVAQGAPEHCPWLDHGRWPHTQPLALRPGPAPSEREPPEFSVSDEPGVMQVPLGPIHGLIEEPAHLRLTLRGEAVVRADAWLGYAHKGILMLMRGKSPRTAARFAARLAAEATVAHATAFARAAEAAVEIEPPPRAAQLRMVMAELERIISHLDDLGRLAEAAGLGIAQATLGFYRERLLRAADRAFGHRLMMDLIVPGGISADIIPGGLEAIGATLSELGSKLPDLRRKLDPLLIRLNQVGLINSREAGGVVGRAALHGFDARHLDPQYRLRDLLTPREQSGDAAARCRVRLAEIGESIRLCREILSELPDGAVGEVLPAESGEGLGCAESPRGDVWHWLRLDHGQIAAAFLLDPGWILWSLAASAIAGATAEEVAMIRLSCGLPVSALDL